MCTCIKDTHLLAGWLCCACRGYNGLQRTECKGCGGARCRPLSADEVTGERFETYEEAYAGDPGMLDLIREQLARSN